ncbi:MAG: DUF3035 domain-containing protein [Proteobacteria bacterium]|nr:DUF3035 domain-containing protein [Pseudomonadota bacterium]MDA1355535.1 DUF3035 domain-containing protein [Pseudomonadota bacterium]
MAGCGGVGKSLGFGKQSLDEFAVVRNAPLTLPPDYSLRPPRPGAQRPQEENLRTQAENAVFSRENETDGASPRLESEGEYALLRRADALETNPNIKREINEEFTIYAQEGEGFFESLLFWQAEQPLGVSINAEEEAQRLNENAALGLPPNTGDTPVIERRDQALFEGIF